MRKRRTRKKTGASLFLRVSAFFLAALICAPFAFSSDRGAAYALIAGTVFREPGFALPGAQIELTVKDPPGQGKRPKPQRAVSDRRGEFSFRVPASKAEYLLKVKADGYEGEERAVAVGGDERLDVFFTLKPSPR
jgi:hypothetical protein